MMAFSLSRTAGVDSPSATTKSAVVLVIFFFITGINSSSGWPLIYTPSTSFSKPSIISLSYSPTSGSFTSSSSFSSSAAKSSRDNCPVRVIFFSWLIPSRMPAYALIFCFLVPSRQSSAPALIKLSSVRLLIDFPLIREQRSFSERNPPPAFRSFVISSITGLPTLLIAASPYLIPPSVGVNAASPSLISGGRIEIPICRHVMEYSVIFPVLSITEVRSAAINSSV